MRDAAKHAASFGILYNDARSGSTFLTDPLFDMVRTAEHRVVVSTKIMDDTRMKKRVADAAARGVDVAFTDIRSMGMHGNLVVADNSVYFGTAHMSSRSLGDMRYAYRQSRELGIVQHDAKLAQGMLARLDEIGMPRFTAEEFSKSVKLDAEYGPMRRLDDKIGKLQLAKEPVPPEDEAKLAEMKEELAAGTGTRLKELRDGVAAKRAEDGLKFSNLPTGPSKASARRAAAAEADARAAEKAARKADKGQHGFRAGFKRMWGI
ncbi:MAG: hypothetical protein JWM98_555, partial [Thermoleophilia bacterium]|nr:hypothetical protein [Thermoleophilia bacterium]